MLRGGADCVAVCEPAGVFGGAWYGGAGVEYDGSEFVAVVECGGVGFKCFASTTTITSLTSIGTNVELLTYMSIREDAMDLYGFSTANELEAFKLLISISGVGPKAAISILSALSPDKLALAISCGDTKSIQAAQGIGKGNEADGWLQEGLGR